MIERTLVVIKPDGVQRGLVGKIIARFEDAGMKIVGMKMAWIDKDFAKRHYTEEIAKKHGEHVRKFNIDFITEGPVVALAIEGINVIENVRKMIGTTEPRQAQPGTIRGDFSHVSYEYADKKKMVVRNVVHASSSKQDAAYEIKLWFISRELHDYKSKFWEVMH